MTTLASVPTDRTLQTGTVGTRDIDTESYNPNFLYHWARAMASKPSPS